MTPRLVPKPKEDAPAAPPFTPEQVAWLTDMLERRERVERDRERAFWDGIRQDLGGVIARIDARHFPERKKVSR